MYKLKILKKLLKDDSKFRNIMIAHFIILLVLFSYTVYLIITI
jgi:hypothetical protein